VAEISADAAGAAIALTGRAPVALADMGVLEQCAHAGRVIPVNFLASQRDVAGNPFKIAGMPQLPSGWRGRAIVKLLQWAGKLPPGPGAISIYRPSLSEILREEATRLGARIRIPWHIEKLDSSPDGVQAEFAGGERARYDLAVGADGVHSKVRDLVFGGIVKPEFSGQVSLRWMSPGPHAPGPAGFYNAGGSTQVAIGDLPGPMSYVATGFDAMEPGRIGPEEARAKLRAILEVFTAPKIVALRNRLNDDADVICRPFEWLLVPNPWYRNRVVLIGDAAHATTAHLASGGGMAMEDAVVLAQTLASAGSVPEGLGEFMRRRFQRVQRVVEGSLKIGELMQKKAPILEIQKVRMDAMRMLAQPY
jgi:2-polyprenyl-6-methoxyphenol hydroxylase-like FAD-dependent oxidoreductase